MTAPFSAPQSDLFGNGQAPWFARPAALPTSFSSAPVQTLLPPAPLQGKGMSLRTGILIGVVVIALLAFVYMFRGRLFVKKDKNPYASAISAITNAQRQADMREWANLWQISRRPTVKRVLADVLNAELGVAAPAPTTTTSPPATTTPVDTTAALPPPPPDATADPAFTVQ